MLQFEIADGIDHDFNYNKDYSKVPGSDKLHKFFKLLRVSWYFEPFRVFDWESNRWWISDNYWSAFWLTPEEAENLTFEDLFFNLSLAQNRTRDRRSMH